MFRELLDFLGDLDADTVTLTASKVHDVQNVQIQVSRTVQDDKVLTMTYLLSVADILAIQPSLLAEVIKQLWIAGNKNNDTNWSGQ